MPITRIENHALEALQRLPQQFKTDLITPLVPRFPPINYPVDGIALAAAMGFANSPTSYWHFKATAGIESDLVGSNDLTPTNTPTQGVDSTPLDSKTVQFTGDSTEAMEASGSGVLDITTGSVAVLWVGILAGPVRNSIMGKRQNVGNTAGYELALNASSQIAFEVDDDPGFQSEGVAMSLAVPVAILGVYDTNADSHKVHVWVGGTVTSSTGATASLGDVTNTVKFAVGDVGITRGAAGANCVVAAVWIDAAAEGLVAQNLTNLMTFVGL